MNLYGAICICSLFVALMGVVIVNETISVVNVLNTLVSSVDIQSLEKPHGDTLIGLSGSYLNKTRFDVADICSCRMEDSSSNATCDITTLNSEAVDEEDSSWGDYTILITEGPKKWQQRETVFLDCEHDFVPLITFLVIPQSYEKFSHKIAETNEGIEDDVWVKEFIQTNFFDNPSPWISSNNLNQVLMSREDHFLGHKPQVSYVQTIVSQASHDKEGYTQIAFSWREGQVTKIDKFSNGSYWSLATLLCTMLLGVERCVAFMLRAKNKRGNVVNTEAAGKNSIANQIQVIPVDDDEPLDQKTSDYDDRGFRKQKTSLIQKGDTEGTDRETVFANTQPLAGFEK